MSVGSAYEVALYWGVISALSELKDSGKSLQDLSPYMYIQYGGQNWWEWWTYSAIGRDEEGNIAPSIENLKYECGIPNIMYNATARSQRALLPSVYTDWILDRIKENNGLDIVVDSATQDALHEMVVPFTTRKVINEDKAFDVQFTKVNVKSKGSTSAGATVHTLYATPESDPRYDFVATTVHQEVGKKTFAFDATAFKANGSISCIITAKVECGINAGVSRLYLLLYDGSGWQRSERTYRSYLTLNYTLKAGDMVAIYCDIENSNIIDIQRASMSIQVHADEGEPVDAVFGQNINTRNNLPTIKQLDFIKAIMAMFGLWATRVNDTIYLVSTDDFYNGEQPTLDWSDKLIASKDADAMKTEYKLSDYAQINRLKYKKDDTTTIDANGELVVEDLTLTKEKDLATLPFAASDGNIIPMYKWKDNNSGTGVVEDAKVEPRIMLIDEESRELSFNNLTFDKLVKRNYNAWQNVMRNPIVIEEQMYLSEIDIKNLDYRKPIYLQKYGARFAVQKVQWSEGEESTVTLVYLPPKENIDVALPYTITTAVAFAGGTTMNPELSILPAYAKLVSGAGSYFAENAVLEFDNNNGEIGFKYWATEAGLKISEDNPYIYDGSNGDMMFVAVCADIIIT